MCNTVQGYSTRDEQKHHASLGLYARHLGNIITKVEMRLWLSTAERTLYASRQDGRAGEPKSVAQATAALYGVTSYEEQLSFKNQVLRDEVFLRLPTMIK